MLAVHPPTKDIKPYIHRLTQGELFNIKDAQTAFEFLISGDATDAQIGAFLIGLAARGETIQEIIGAVQAMRGKQLPIDAPTDAVDCCGTGGDGANTFNISTAVSFIAAGCGVPVAKHGNRSASSKSGAADVLEALGINLTAPTTAHYKALRRHNICFLMAQKHHPAAKHVAPVRSQLGTRTIFNLLGPLLNPAGTKKQLIGVYDKKWMKPLAEVLKILGSETAWIVHGSDGLDEITTTGKTFVTELRKGKIQSFEIHPHEVDIGLYTLEDLKGGTPQENAQALKELLNGKRGAYRDIALLNSAAVLVVADKAQNLKEGFAMAAHSLDNGLALNALQKLIELTNK